MAFIRGFAEVSLEVTDAPGCFLTATPTSRVVAQGDVASYLLTVTRAGGYTGPIYLRAVNLSAVEPQPTDPSENSHHFTPNPIPPGETTSMLTIETDGWMDRTPWLIGIEGLDVLPDGEYPVT